MVSFVCVFNRQFQIRLVYTLKFRFINIKNGREIRGITKEFLRIGVRDYDIIRPVTEAIFGS